jgi:hypothetical protein
MTGSSRPPAERPHFPNKYFNQEGATTTRHIFLPDGTLVATIVATGSATTTTYIHPDHLGGTNVMAGTSTAIRGGKESIRG